MLDDLPIEVLELVLDNLPQISLINLNLTSKKFNHLIRSRFFKSVEVNNQKKLVSNDILYEENFSTLITSIYSLKTFLKKLLNSPENCKLVQKLIFKHLPDLPEDLLIGYLEVILPYLINLTEFKWYSNYNLDFKIINLIPNYKLNKLNGNFKSFDKFNNNNFKNLKSLSLSGFKNFQNININLDYFKTLKHLKISKKNFILIEDDLEKLLANCNPLNLVALSLENLYLTYNDIQVLKDKINFEHLQVLKLNNCYEIYHEYDNVLTTINNINNGSLANVELNLLNNENNNHYIYQFLGRQKNMKSLKVKLNLCDNLNKGLNNLLEVLPRTLFNLEVDFFLKGNTNMHSLNCHNQIDIVNSLNKFKNLETLNFPISLETLASLYLDLPHLHVLEFSIIDILIFKNSLISLDSANLNIHQFKNIISQIDCHELQFLIIKMFEYHILDIKNNVFNNLPQLYH